MEDFHSNAKPRDGFATKMGVLAAVAGSAVGLGNIWKFPYITGVNGGAAFVLVYLGCIVVIGLPVMLSEFIIGRRSQANAVGAFKKLAPGTPWFLTGIMGVFTVSFILAYYAVVAGWTLEYIVRSLTNSFAGHSPEELGAMFGGFISMTGRPIFWQVVFMAITSLIVLAGVKSGIEKASKILMPLLVLIIIVLDIRALTLPGASEGLAFLFKPEWSKLTAAGALAALGHAFFSLSLGMGTLITYGSYMRKNENLGNTALQVTIADTVIALMAGIAIFPAVFAFNIEPAAGPGLVFITLPNVFNQIPGGQFFALLFFILVAIAALTSTVSILEVVVAYFAEELKMSRAKATLISGVGITILGLPCSLSQGVMADFKIFGRNFFDTMDFLTANIMMPLGGLLVTAFVGWYLSRKVVEDEVTNSGTRKAGYVPFFMFLSKFVAPLAIAMVFLNGMGWF